MSKYLYPYRVNGRLSNAPYCCRRSLDGEQPWAYLVLQEGISSPVLTSLRGVSAYLGKQYRGLRVLFTEEDREKVLSGKEKIVKKIFKSWEISLFLKSTNI
jgi:hypothetical protein